MQFLTTIPRGPPGESVLVSHRHAKSNWFPRVFLSLKWVGKIMAAHTHVVLSYYFCQCENYCEKKNLYRNKLCNLKHTSQKTRRIESWGLSIQYFRRCHISISSVNRILFPAHGKAIVTVLKGFLKKDSKKSQIFNSALSTLRTQSSALLKLAQAYVSTLDLGVKAFHLGKKRGYSSIP